MPVLILLMSLSFLACQCQSHCAIQGEWQIKSGRLFENYELASEYSFNRISFSTDSVELASGFFYRTEDLINNWPIRRYPFVYYGKKEKYKLSGDSLHIYSMPYKSWRSFKITCIGNDELQLIGKKKSLRLFKYKSHSEVLNCSIDYIKAHVIGNSLDVFKINYRVTYSRDDSLIFEEWDSKSNKFKLNKIKLKAGTFKNICLGFGGIDVLALKSLYPSRISEINTTKIEIGLTNGEVVKSELQNEDYPDDLRFALIPVLFTHQKLLYNNLPSVK